MNSFHPGPHALWTLLFLFSFLSASDLAIGSGEKFKEDLIGRYDRSGSLESETFSWPSFSLTNSSPEELVGLSRNEAFDLLEEQLRQNSPSFPVTLKYLYFRIFSSNSMALLTSPRVLNSEPIFAVVSRLLFYNMRRVVQAVCDALSFNFNDETILLLIDNFWDHLVGGKSPKLPGILRVAIERNRYVVAEEIILKFKELQESKIDWERKELLSRELELRSFDQEVKLIEQAIHEAHEFNSETHEVSQNTGLPADYSMLESVQQLKEMCVHLQEEYAKFNERWHELADAEKAVQAKVATLINYVPDSGLPIAHFLARQQASEESVNDSIELFKLLALHGLNVDALDSAGRTPLHLAVFLDNKPFQTALLEAGADGKAQFAGFTAVAWADTAALGPSVYFSWRRAFPSHDQFLKRQEEAMPKWIRKQLPRHFGEKNRLIAPFIKSNR